MKSLTMIIILSTVIAAGITIPLFFEAITSYTLPDGTTCRYKHTDSGLFGGGGAVTFTHCDNDKEYINPEYYIKNMED